MFTLVGTALAQAGTVAEIIVVGNNRVTKEAIIAQLRTKVGQPFLKANLTRDRQILIDQGFFEAVEMREKVLETERYQVTITVKEFPVIKEIRITGNKAVPTAEILKVVTNKPGEVFNLNLAKPIANAIRDLYIKKGFFGQVEEFGPANDSPGTLSIKIIEVTVGDVKVRGALRTKPEILKRLIHTRTGDPYSVDKWSGDLRRVYNTQWFEDIKPFADDQRELGRVDLGMDVKEGRTGQFNVGVQLDPRNNLAGIISLSESNLYGTGRGVKFNFTQATQGAGPSVDLDYTNPFYDQRDTVFRAAIYSRVIFRFTNQFQSSTLNSGNNYNERRSGGTFGFTRPVSDSTSFGVSLRAERVITNNVGTTSADQYVQQDGDVAMVSFSGTRNRRDVDVDPSRGDLLRVDLEPGYSNITQIGGAAGANTDILGRNLFGRMMIDYRTYFTKEKPRGMDLESPRHVIAFRVRAGAITGKVPFFEQFFAGGSDSIRGYQQDRFWGRQILVGNLEYRHPIQKGFSIIGFVDYGGAWGGYGAVNSLTQSDSFNLNMGYGVGLSFRTPLGPIRLDLGFTPSGQSQTHFMIGTSF